MSRRPKELVERLVEARNARADDRAAHLLADDVRYWDCLRGDVAGRDTVVAALAAAHGTRLAVETLTGDETHVVVELRVDGERPHRATEVYVLGDDARIASCRVYFDPQER
ncbi:MAG: nuclear transport factor 2 family protein [Gaiellaceae bacterium]